MIEAERPVPGTSARGQRRQSRKWASGVVAATAIIAASALSAEITCHEGIMPAKPAATVARSDFGMVASGSPEATQAGVETLERGGNAIDAAVAAALMLGVADPDASGLGGMTSMVIRLEKGRSLVFNGIAPSPQGVDPASLAAAKSGKLRTGYELVAVPTTLAVLEQARSRYGSMSLAELLEPAIEVASHGYRVNPVQIIWTYHYLEEILASRFIRLTALRDGSTLGRPGDIVCRPELARTMSYIARHGVSAFYRGPIADLIERDMVRNGGFVRKTDLARLRIAEEPPLRTTYRGRRVSSIPPPGGGSTVAEALEILETFPSDFLAADTPERHHTLLEASRIALADRGLVPRLLHSLHGGPSSDLRQERARERASLIAPEEIIPDSVLYAHQDPACAPSGESTTQVSVADRWGNTVSLTQTLGRSWGSKVMSPDLGFPYNSLLEGFNHDKPQCPGYLQPGMPCPNDMAPTIVLAEDGSLLGALGTPGSDLIPSIIVNVVSNLIDRGMPLEEAIAAPRVLYGGLEVPAPYIEARAPISDEDIDALEAIGHSPIERLEFPPTSACSVYYGGVNAVGWDRERSTFVGVGDGRRWGSAQGARVVAEPRVSR